MSLHKKLSSIFEKVSIDLFNKLCNLTMNYEEANKKEEFTNFVKCVLIRNNAPYDESKYVTSM